MLAGLQTKVGVLETENAALKNRVDKPEASLESAEQYSRRNCLKISGVPENIDKSTDEYVCELARAIDVDIKWKILTEAIDWAGPLLQPNRVADHVTSSSNLFLIEHAQSFTKLE